MAVFEKGERLRHIGHLDVMRAMQRALRRSGVPVKYSQGFNPHILLTFASALSTGAAGRKEIMDVTMEREITPEEFMARMNEALPPDMRLTQCRAMDDRHPALMAMVTAASYDLRVTDVSAAEKMRVALDGFMAQDTIMAIRRTKSGEKECDCKGLIHALSMEGQTLRAVMTLTERESCKPDMLLSALSSFAGIEAPHVIVTRTGLWGLDASGALAPLETL